MRVPRFATLLALPFAVAIGCVPVQFISTRDDGSGGEGGATGYGGDIGVTITGTSTSGGTGGGGTSSGFAGPLSYAYMCGGSQAACEPGADASECAPGGTGNMGGASPDAGIKLTCQLIADGDHAAAKCGLAGGAGDGDPCHQAADCAAGLGCATSSVVSGVCRHYCCGDPEQCPAQTFCQPTQMAEAEVEVPLCVWAKPCELLNDGAHCNDGQTCTIVRADGTTSCVDPGSGHEGDACPCAAGFVCSNATGTCVKLCHLEGDECGNGTCQGGTLPYPAGIGFCVPL